MIKKALVFLVIYLAGNGNAYAQRAVGFFDVGFSLFTPWDDADNVAILPSITLIPGLWLFHDKKVSLSLSVPVSFGGTFKSDAFLGMDAPVMLSFGFGSATVMNNTAKFGIILGAGAGYTNVVNNYESDPSEKIQVEFFGYRLHAGVSFKGDKDNSVIPALVLSFGKPFTNTSAYIFGFGVHLLIGNK